MSFLQNSDLIAMNQEHSLKEFVDLMLVEFDLNKFDCKNIQVLINVMKLLVNNR